MRSFPSYLAASALLVALVAGGACAPKGQPASSAGQAPAAPRSPGAAGAGSIQCGKALCKAGSEVCCGNQYTGSCRPDAGPDLAGLNKDERARRTVEHLVRVADHGVQVPGHAQALRQAFAVAADVLDAQHRVAV